MPYHKCSSCNKRFKREIEYLEHKKEKHGDNSYFESFSCSICYRTFRRDSHRKQHMENPGKRHDPERLGRRGGSTSSLVSRRFLDNPSLDLNEYIADNLQPDKAFHDRANEAIDALYRELQQDMKHTEYQIHNLIKGGSMAKGTALKNNSDLDCVMIVNDIDDASQLKRKLPYILSKLKTHLVGKTIQGSWTLTEITTTRFSLQFKMTRNPQEEVKVDLLPTFEADVEDGNVRKNNVFYREMLSNRDDWQYYSASLVKLQRDFVKESPPNVKDLIRLVKHWRKELIPQDGNTRVPSSYFMELITIDAWNDAGRPSTFDMKIGFKAVMKMLRDHGNIGIAWTRNYDSTTIPDGMLSCPCLIDPANPTNDMYDSVDCWDRVKRVAIETMQKPLIRGVTATSNWN